MHQSKHLPSLPPCAGFGREIEIKFREAEESGKTLIVTVLSAMGREQITAVKEEATKDA